MSTSGHTAQYYWQGGSGSWDSYLSWNHWDESIPSDGDSAYVENGGTVEVPISVSGAYSLLELGAAVTPGSSGGILFSGGTLLGVSANLAGYEGQATAQVLSGTWINSQGLSVGSGGSGSLAIEGGYVSSHFGSLANTQEAEGTALITGGTWNSTHLVVGDWGLGTLTLDGGLIANTSTTIGGNSTGLGTAFVQSGTWSSSSLDVGYSGTGALTLESGLVSSTIGIIGGGDEWWSPATAQGTILVNGGTWNSDSSIRVGNHRNGTLTVSGGLVSTDDAYLGYWETAEGSAMVSSGTWSVAGTLSIGHIGTGELTVEGGEVSGSNVYVGYYEDAEGTVIVSDGVLNAGSLSIGHFGTGFVTVEGTSGAQGLISSYQIRKGNGDGSLGVNGGGLKALGDEEVFLLGFGQGDVNIGANGAFIDSQSFTIGISTELGGTGGLTKQGEGTLILSGSNNYLGDTVVDSGTLLVTGHLSSTGNVVVTEEATLGGTGAIGNVFVSGTLAPGNSPGMLSIAGDLSMDSMATLIMEFDSLGSFDQLTIGGNLLVDNTQLVAQFNYTPDIGDAFQIFIKDGFSSGEFVLVSNLGNGLAIDASLLSINGTITIVPEPHSTTLLVMGLGALFWRCARKKNQDVSS